MNSVDNKPMTSESSVDIHHKDKKGYKHTKLGWIPEEWEIANLGDVSRIERGRFSPRPRNDPKFYGGKIPFVQTGDVTNSDGYIKTYSQTLNEEGLKVSKVFDSGTILMTIASNIGHTGVLAYNMACPDSLVGIIPNDNIDNIFLNYSLSKYQKRLEYIAPGGQKNINIEFLKPFSIVLPPLPEQKKIAQILSAWDEAISKTEQLITKKQERKKGLMQELLTGKRRFKEFVKSDKMKETKLGLIPEDWEVKTLEDIYLTMKSGLSRKLSNEDIGLPVLRSNNLIDNKVDFNDIKYWYLDDPQGSSTENYFLRDGDLLVNFINSLAQIGKCAYYQNELNRNVIYTTNILALRLDKKKVFPAYFLDYTLTRRYKDFVQSITKPAVNQASFTTKDFRRLEIPLPSLPEQQKIASVLSEADQEIERLQNQLAKLREQKKGLMQKLLTGEVRVKVEKV